MSQTNLCWPAPAKLNLLLNITGRRPDGYHELQTVFQFLDIADELTFEVDADGGLQREYELNGVSEDRDLILRAARLLKQETGSPLGARINLRKHLPMGGGLGGGSSDAATTLVALNYLWRTDLTESDLCRLGLGLGADVPVFIHGRATWAEGVGERFTAITIPEPWYVVLIPGIEVATGEIFSAPELTRHAPALKIRDFLGGRAYNLCEPVVRARYPQVDQAMTWLEQYAPARLTGTGACVFAELMDAAHGRHILQQLPSPWRGFIAKGMNNSLLQAHLTCCRG